MSRYWVSWYSKHMGEFELHSPWWISGYRCDDEAQTVCAAVIAEDEQGAMAAIVDAHDDPTVEIEWRFCNERDKDWSPFCDRFPRADWMRWLP